MTVPKHRHPEYVCDVLEKADNDDQDFTIKGLRDFPDQSIPLRLVLAYAISYYKLAMTLVESIEKKINPQIDECTRIDQDSKINQPEKLPIGSQLKLRPTNNPNQFGFTIVIGEEIYIGSTTLKKPNQT